VSDGSLLEQGWQIFPFELQIGRQIPVAAAVSAAKLEKRIRQINSTQNKRRKI
jgi:hypothetical protein